MATRAEVINSLKRARSAGLNLSNLPLVLGAVLDAVIYLVENTPGQLPDAKGIPIEEIKALKALSGVRK